MLERRYTKYNKHHYGATLESEVLTSGGHRGCVSGCRKGCPEIQQEWKLSLCGRMCLPGVSFLERTKGIFRRVPCNGHSEQHSCIFCASVQRGAGTQHSDWLLPVCNQDWILCWPLGSPSHLGELLGRTVGVHTSLGRMRRCTQSVQHTDKNLLETKNPL